LPAGRSGPLPPKVQPVKYKTLGVTATARPTTPTAIPARHDTHGVIYVPSGRYIVHETLISSPTRADRSIPHHQFDLPETRPVGGVRAQGAGLENNPRAATISCGDRNFNAHQIRARCGPVAIERKIR